MSKSYQSQYAEILRKLINNPAKKTPSRIGDIGGNFFEYFRINLQHEFPLMDIKKIQFSNIVHELLWFVKGDTCAKYLIDNGCNIWTDDAFRYYNEKYVPLGAPKMDKDEFIQKCKSGDTYNFKRDLWYAGEGMPKNKEYYEFSYTYGDLDRIYGKQWREFNGKTDQLQNCVNTLLTNPNDRRMIVSAHNPTDIEDKIVGLPSCHNFFQFHTIPLTHDERIKLYVESVGKLPYGSEKNQHAQLNDKLIDIPTHYLNLWFNIRSNDFFLGNSYNIASYALLSHIVGNITNMIPNELVCTAIDCHLYDAHIEPANEWLRRYDKIVNDNPTIDGTYCKSKIVIKRKLNSIDDISADDFALLDYNPQPYIKAQLLT